MELRTHSNERPRRAGASLLLLAAALVVPIAAHQACGHRAARFSSCFASPRELAGAVLAAAHAHDRQALESLALTENEFRDEVFPEMPSYRKIPLGYVWGDLQRKSGLQIDRILARSGGWDFEVERVTFDGGSTAYDTFVVHRKPRLHLRERSTGKTIEVALFGSVLQDSGRYKLFSYVVNR